MISHDATPDYKPTIAIDFDGVIHLYSNGWQNGVIYDDPVPGALETICKLIARGYPVFVHSARSPRKIKRWLEEQTPFNERVSVFDWIPVQIVPWWSRFWDKTGVLGVTNRKMAAVIYIDDRAYLFSATRAPEHWAEILARFP